MAFTSLYVYIIFDAFFMFHAVAASHLIWPFQLNAFS